MRYKTIAIAFTVACHLHARTINIEAIALPIKAHAVALGGLRCRFESYEDRQILFNVNVPYGLNSLSERTLAYLGKIRELDIDCAMVQEGNADLNATTYAFGVTKRLSSVYHAGIKGYYTHTITASGISGNLFIVEINGKWLITPSVQAILSFLNPNASAQKIGEHWYSVTSAAYTAIQYTLNNQSQLYGEVDLFLHQKPRIRMGINFAPCNELQIQIGISDKPWTPSWGVGIQKNRWSMNYAGSTHPILGLSTGLSLGYIW